MRLQPRISEYKMYIIVYIHKIIDTLILIIQTPQRYHKLLKPFPNRIIKAQLQLYNIILNFPNIKNNFILTRSYRQYNIHICIYYLLVLMH